MKSMAKVRNLPPELTSYDLLKAAAVIIMVIDHLGFYFSPYNDWYRVIGRTGFPIWFFLVGYARGRDISPKLFGGALILTLGDFVSGMNIFPLNALATIILIRLALTPIMTLSCRHRDSMVAVAIVLIFLVIPTGELAEYGTQALITAMFGYVVRNRPVVPQVKTERNIVLFYAVITFLSFIIIEQFLFQFSLPQFVFMSLGTFYVMNILYRFQSISYPILTQTLPRSITFVIQFMGRRTLEIYVAHLLLFKGLCLWLQPARFVLGHFHWHGALGL